MSMGVRSANFSVSFKGHPFSISHELVDTLFYWMSERHSIHERRLRCEDSLTNDPILQEYKFTNVFRVFDRNSQYVLNTVIPGGSGGLEETCFRVILFRMFNRIETWKLLTREFGSITWENFDIKCYNSVLHSVTPVHGHAYYIPAPPLGGYDNISNHLRLVKLLMEMGLPQQLREYFHMRDAFQFIRLFPSMGDFTGFQLLLDLNMTDHFDFAEDEWVACGPGSRRGLERIFGKGVRGLECEAIGYLYKMQHQFWKRISVDPPAMHPNRQGVSFVDLEHSLCEFDKYCRKKFPDRSNRRKEIKQKYHGPNRSRYTADLPEKWTRIRKVDKMGPPPPSVIRNGIQLYEVSHIVAESGKKFLVRWMGYLPQDDTWEDADNLADNGAEDVLSDWRANCQVIEDKIKGLCSDPMEREKRQRPHQVDDEDEEDSDVGEGICKRPKT